MEHPRSRARDALRGLVRVTVACLVLLPALTVEAQTWKPAKNIEIVVASGAGGAADRQGRAAQRFLQSLPGIPSVTVTNRPGGGGTVAWTFVNQHPGDAHYISTFGTAILTNEIIGLSTVRYQDVTPLNILVREYVVAWTRSDSPVASARDLLARLKRDPQSVSFGFSSARGNQNHIVIGMLARAAGVDPRAVKTVVYSSGGQGMTAALGGHVDVWVGTAGGTLPHIESGRIRVLGVSSEERQKGLLAAAPTFREQGVDATYYAWRGFLAPAKLSPAQIAFWDSAFAKVIEDRGWKDALDANAWSEDFRGSAETRRHLDLEHALLAKVLAELGLVKRQP
jgi:putative tricarboxylic transport membrane protein